MWSKFFNARFNIRYGISRASYKSSSIWVGVRGSLAIIKQHAHWVIGNGSSVLIWQDQWCSHLPPPPPHAIMDQCLSNWIHNGRWKLPQWLLDSFPQEAALITQIPLPLHQNQDCLVWPNDHKGHLTFQQAYIHFHPPSENPEFRYVWKPFMPPRSSMLLWRALHNSLPSQELLQKKGVYTASRCSLCHKHTESTPHVLLQCPFSVAIWSWFLSLFQIAACPTDSVKSLWQFISKQHFSSRVHNALLVGTSIVLHKLWEVRNAAIFDNVKPNLGSLRHHIMSCIAERDNLISGSMFNSIHDLAILKAFNLSLKPAACPKILEVYWTPPPPGWIKVNTDGMAAGCPGSAAIGGIFRNSRGFCKGIFCGSVGSQVAFYAEMAAIIQAIEFAWLQGWRKLWFEMDSLAVLLCLLNMNSQVPWHLKTRWVNCRFYLSHMQFYASHIYREGNKVADFLSKKGLQFPCIQWWSNPTADLVNLVNHDMSLKPNYRFVHY